MDQKNPCSMRNTSSPQPAKAEHTSDSSDPPVVRPMQRRFNVRQVSKPEATITEWKGTEEYTLDEYSSEIFENTSLRRGGSCPDEDTTIDSLTLDDDGSDVERDPFSAADEEHQRQRMDVIWTPIDSPTGSGVPIKGRRRKTSRHRRSSSASSAQLKPRPRYERSFHNLNLESTGSVGTRVVSGGVTKTLNPLWGNDQLTRLLASTYKSWAYSVSTTTEKDNLKSTPRSSAGQGEEEVGPQRVDDEVVHVNPIYRRYIPKPSKQSPPSFETLVQCDETALEKPEEQRVVHNPVFHKFIPCKPKVDTTTADDGESTERLPVHEEEHTVSNPLFLKFIPSIPSKKTFRGTAVPNLSLQRRRTRSGNEKTEKTDRDEETSPSPRHSSSAMDELPSGRR